MKKLNKNINVKKESIESYNMYSDCNCECSTYCNKRFSSYQSLKGLQGSNAYHN